MTGIAEIPLDGFSETPTLNHAAPLIKDTGESSTVHSDIQLNSSQSNTLPKPDASVQFKDDDKIGAEGGVKLISEQVSLISAAFRLSQRVQGVSTRMLVTVKYV